MAITYCPNCSDMLLDGKTIFGYPHTCNPSYMCYADQYMEEDEAKRICANSAEKAAEKFAEDFFSKSSPDYFTELHVVVISPAGEKTAWNVRVENQPVFESQKDDDWQPPE